MEMEEESYVFESDDEVIFKKKRKKNWTDSAEMDAFLNLLEENCVELSLLKRNLNLYTKMSYKMAKLGFRREPSELRKKLSNIFSKYKHEKKLNSTDWPYFDRVHELLSKMKSYNPGRFIHVKKQEDNEESIPVPVKSNKEIQKLVLISPGSNVCIDEADMETILKAMNGEDISNIGSDESSSALESSGTIKRLADSNQAAETENNESMSDDIELEISYQPATLENIPKNHNVGEQCTTLMVKTNASDNHKMDHQYTMPIAMATRNISNNHSVDRQYMTSTVTAKRKSDYVELHPRKEKALALSKEPIIIKEAVKKTDESKTCHCEKDEVDLYTSLLATKLKRMDEKSRHIAMNKIDNIVFQMKMKEFEC